MSSHVDVDPVEPRGEGSGRRRRDDQPVVAVDEADDLTQHGKEVAVAEPVCVVDAHRQVGMALPEPDELRAVARSQEGDPGCPQHVAGVGSRANADDEPPLGTQRFGDNPEGIGATGPRWACDDQAAAIPVGVPAARSAPVATDAQKHPLVVTGGAHGIRAPGRHLAAADSRREGDPPPRPGVRRE